MKSEPATFGIDHLDARPGRKAGWDGVRNYQARNMLRDDFKAGTLNQNRWPELLKAYGERQPKANIWGLPKNQVNHRIYVTDAKGIVVRDLVNFLVYVGEPSAQSRKSIGIVVLFVLGVLFMLAYAMKQAFWKDIR